ncbi:hypothetical protein QVD17_07039 [Tagetes erecta]|uniref:Uncharacterized protein n=1 Tax=Tagetes erecta TaxID=13708 RepID=A0AAD8PBS9_TARER|nr:hypothetical protein QVD17_07039 [Tagetes erecta]
MLFIFMNKAACTTNQKAMDPAKTQKLYENELSADAEKEYHCLTKNWKWDEVIDISSSEDDEDLEADAESIIEETGLALPTTHKRARH